MPATVLAFSAGLIMVPTVASAAASGHATAADAPTAPPPITTLMHGIGDKEGDFFISPNDPNGTYANGVEIVNGNGQELFFHAVPAGDTATDFRQQSLDGQPVLTWWQGTGIGGLSNGQDIIADMQGNILYTVTAGDGDTTDGHEFLIAPDGSAVVDSYDLGTADLTSIGGPSDQSVINGIVQDINIQTGAVIASWNSADHVPYSASEQPFPNNATEPWDWFHVNSVAMNQGGNSVLIDGRNVWATYNVSINTGKTIWTMGGKDSSFTMTTAKGQTLDSAGEIFSWQHNVESLGHNKYTWFDNDNAVTPLLPYSRVVKVSLNTKTGVATLLKSYDQPSGLSAHSEGNGQKLPDGNFVIGWGALPYFSEFTHSGTLLDYFQFPSGVDSYRAFRAPWAGAA